MLQTMILTSIAIFSVSLNIMCAVQPSYKSVAAMPDDATTKQILALDLTLTRTKINITILLVPAGATRKNIFPSLQLIDHMNASHIFWSVLKHKI